MAATLRRSSLLVLATAPRLAGPPRVPLSTPRISAGDQISSSTASFSSSRYGHVESMAWKSSGGSNRDLIENMWNNSLIQTQAVKDAFLKVRPSKTFDDPRTRNSC